MLALNALVWQVRTILRELWLQTLHFFSTNDYEACMHACPATSWLPLTHNALHQTFQMFHQTLPFGGCGILSHSKRWLSRTCSIDQNGIEGICWPAVGAGSAVGGRIGKGAHVLGMGPAHAAPAKHTHAQHRTCACMLNSAQVHAHPPPHADTSNTPHAQPNHHAFACAPSAALAHAPGRPDLGTIHRCIWGSRQPASPEGDATRARRKDKCPICWPLKPRARHSTAR